MTNIQILNLDSQNQISSLSDQELYNLHGGTVADFELEVITDSDGRIIGFRAKPLPPRNPAPPRTPFPVGFF